MQQLFLPYLRGMCLVLFFISFSGFAQQNVEFPVKQFAVVGDNPLSPQKTQYFFRKYENLTFDINRLQSIVNSFEKELRDQGFAFYRVSLPPQTLSQGVVNINIQKIVLSKIDITGNRLFSDNNILSSMPALQVGESPNSKKIVSNLLLAQSNPSKKLNLRFAQGEQPQTIAATIDVQEKGIDDYAFWLNNSGSELSTDYRLGFQASYRNLWDKDHQLSLSYSLSPQDLDKASQYGFNYLIPAYSLNGSFNFLYSDSDTDTGTVAEVFEVNGAGETIGFGYTQNLPKMGRYEHSVSSQFFDKFLESNIDFQGENIGQNVRSRQVILGYKNQYANKKFRFVANTSVAKSLSGGSFNNDEIYAASRVGADADWKKFNLSTLLSYQIKPQLTAGLTLFGQYTDEPLISAEQLGLGGSVGLFGPRGFEEREVSLDRGYKSSLELLKTFPSKKLQVGLFYDYAKGTRLQPQAAETDGESLSSAGMSLRWNVFKNVSLNSQLAYVLNGLNDTQFGSQDGDMKLHFSLLYTPNWSVFK